MNPMKACSFLALALLTPVFGADANPPTTLDAAKKVAAAATAQPEEQPGGGKKKQHAKKHDGRKPSAKPVPSTPAVKAMPMAKQEAKPAPKKAAAMQARARNGLDALSDKQLKETLDATRSQLAANAKKHDASHTDWVKARKDAQAIEDEIARLKQALAELDRKAGATARDIKKLEDLHAATEQTEKALRSTLAAQEKELAKRSEIRKLEEQAAKLKAQAEALEKRAAELK